MVALTEYLTRKEISHVFTDAFLDYMARLDADPERRKTVLAMHTRADTARRSQLHMDPDGHAFNYLAHDKEQ